MDRSVASNTRGPRFESFIEDLYWNFNYYVNCKRKAEKLLEQLLAAMQSERKMQWMANFKKMKKNF